MIIDNIINDLDSGLYASAEYHDPDLELFRCDNGGFLLVSDVTEAEFLRLRKEPNDETIQELLDCHYNEFHSYGR